MEIKKNDCYEVTIEDMTVAGEGVGKVEGYPFFVKDTVVGDRVKILAIKVKKNYGYGKVLEVRSPSKDRVEPRCSVATSCGGCIFQHISYEKQLELKQNHVKNCLEKIGGLQNIEQLMEPIIGMEEPYFYRNKAQFPIGTNKNEELVAGFYARRTHSIIHHLECQIQHPVNETILKMVLSFMKKYQVPAYDEVTHTGLVRHVLTRVGFVTKEIMVCLVVNGKKIPHMEELVKSLCTLPNMTSIVLCENTEKTNKILGETIHSIWGQDYIEDYIGDVKYQISALSFFQVNPIQTKVLYETALEYAGLTGEETVWDLYCGIGTISLFLAQRAKQVYGVEIVPEAIEDARRNAKINGLENVTFFVGKAEEVLPEQYEQNQIYADVIVVDPPRKGCDEKCLETIVKMQPKKVVYVSCDPATLARDLKYLTREGYEVRKVQAVDQFCHSGHVETVVLLSQRKADDYVEVELELDELDVTSAESKATYVEIKDYVFKTHGLKVSNLYISQVKRKCGIEVGENYNLPKSEDSRQPQCPEEKEKAIRDALEHFGMA